MLWAVQLVMVVLGLGYYVALTVLVRYYKRNPSPPPVRQCVPKQKISVLVAARNEARTLPLLLQSLAQQNYPPSHFQVIVINDHSTDNTAAVAQAWQPRLPNLWVVNATSSGKKAAIAQGVAMALHPIIATTDADCTLPPNWLLAMNACLAIPNTLMVIAPVAIGGSGFWATVQRTEFLSLVGIGGALAGAGTPLLANGAGLCYHKLVFELTGGYQPNEPPSGDDVNLLQRTHAQRPGSVVFAANDQALVTTQPANTLSAFCRQRLRWAGKWNQMPDKKAATLAVGVWLFYVMQLLVAATAVAHPQLLWALGVFFGIKALADYRLLAYTAHSLGIRLHVGFVLLWQVLYPFYATIIGALAAFNPKTNWKSNKR